MLLSNLGQPLKMKLQTDAHYYKSFCVDHSTRIFVSWQKKFGSVRPPAACEAAKEWSLPPAVSLPNGFKPRKSQLTMRLSASTAVILNSLRSVP
jgi:hypothetical protein